MYNLLCGQGLPLRRSKLLGRLVSHPWYMCRTPPKPNGLRHLIGGNLDDRPSIHLSRVKVVVDNGKYHDGPSHQNAEIHMRGIRVGHLWEEAEDEDDDAVPDPKGIEQYAPNSGYVEWTPYQLVRMPGGTSHLIGVSDIPHDTVIEEHGFGEGIGSVQAADTDGNHSIESSGGADIDQADRARHEGHYENGIQGYCGIFLYLHHSFSSVTKCARDGSWHTSLIVRQNGSPRSRPKAQTMREEVARKAIAAQMSMIMMMHIIVEAPESEPVAS